jgi:hypothetical protein
MPRNSNKRSNARKTNNIRKTRKQKMYIMRGCSKKTKSCKNKKVFSSLGNKSCSKCGPNCHCGPNCNCPDKCPGNCYLDRRQTKGGSGCGSCGCPIAPLSVKQMNQFGGIPNNIPTYVPNVDSPVLISPPNKSTGYIPIPGISQNGGSGCSACGQIPVQNGGNFYKPASPIPGPFVGSAWSPSINDWSSVNGIGGDKNYNYSYDAKNNIIGKDPQLQMSMNDAGYTTLNSMVGGYKYNKKNVLSRSKKSSSKSSSNSNSSSSSNRFIKGGGLVPQDLVNLGNDFSFNLKSAYNALNGYKAPVDPLPYKGQLSNSSNNKIIIV